MSKLISEFAHYSTLSWDEAVKLAANKLAQKRKDFIALDFAKYDDDHLCMLLNELSELEAEVLYAWAYSTLDINPSMKDEVEQGRLRLTLKKKSYIEQHTGVKI